MGLDISFHKNPMPTKETSYEDWKKWDDLNPNLFEPVRYCMQITHNCVNCAEHVKLKTPYPFKDIIYKKDDSLNLYNVLWHGESYNILQGKQMIPFLEEALKELTSNYKYYHQYDAPNGYGDVFTVIRFCIMLLVECKQRPEAYLCYSR